MRKNNNNRRQGRVYAVRGSKEPMVGWSSGRVVSDAKFWRWGDDNLLPNALALMSRRSTTHRRIINDKADYISGKGFSFDQGQETLGRFTERANGRGETLRQVMNKLAFDKALFGNAFLEVMTDEAHTFLSLHHQDASRCRVAKEGAGIILHHDWARFKPSEAQVLPLYPDFTVCGDGLLRSIIHYKDYEPMFENYGVPRYLPALGAATIAYKADRWNISRLDNAFQPSGVMVLDGEVDSEHEAAEIARMAERRFAGKPGQVMFMVKNGIEGDATKFVPISSASDGDWRHLHDQSTSDIIVAHSWFRTLSGMDYSTGFSPERVQYEYNIALGTLISVEQQDILEPICLAIEDILGLDTSSLQFVNRPPFEQKPPYMKVWEARKADGYDYDPEDDRQGMYLSELA